MARDYIQRRPQQTSIASVVVGAMVVALLMLLTYAVVSEFTKPANTGEMREVATPAVMTAEVKEFAAYVQDDAAEEKMTPEHGYASNGLRRLAAALGSLEERGGVQNRDIEQRRKSLLLFADRLQEDKRSMAHADMTREAFMTASGLIADLADKRFHAQREQAQRLQEAALAIDPDRPLLAQKIQVREFFTRASATLQAMSQSGETSSIRLTLRETVL